MRTFLYSCLILAYTSSTTNLLSRRILKKFVNSLSFQIHTLNWTLALIIPIFRVSQPKILQINLPWFKTSVNFFNQVSSPTQDLKRNWVVVPNNWKWKIKKTTSQPSYWWQSINWLVYELFWWLYLSLAINVSIFLSVKPCNL